MFESNIKPLLFSLDNTYYTNEHQEIKFSYIIHTPEIDPSNLIASLKENYIITANINGDPAGYIILGVISSENKDKFLSNPLDWVIYTYANLEQKIAWQAKDYHDGYSFLATFLEIKGLSIQDYSHEKFNQLFQKHVLYGKYEHFINYWIDKPNVELVCVYDNNDDKYKDFHEFPFFGVKRSNPINFRGKGIAQALYEVSGLWMQSKGMHIHSSDKQTNDGKKMWNILSQLPQFKVLLDSYQTTLTNSTKTVIKKERSKLFVSK